MGICGLHLNEVNRKPAASDERLHPELPGLFPDRSSSGLLLWLGRNQRGDRERFVQLEGTRLSVRPEAVEIVHTVGQVGVLLDFSNDDPFADRMDDACFDEKDIPFFDRYAVEHLGDRPIREPAPKLLPADLLTEPKIKGGAFFAVEQIPHLFLALLAIFEFPRVIVVRMHLDREDFFRVDQLDQKREFLFACIGMSQQLRVFCRKL